MSQQLSFDEFVALTHHAKRVVVSREIAAAHLTPMDMVENLSEEMSDGALLESGLTHDESGRYSLIAFHSMAHLKVHKGRVTQCINGHETTSEEHPFVVLRQLFAQLACEGRPDVLGFVCGALGFLTYDAVRLFEDIPDRHQAESVLPEMVFDFYQTTLFFDHIQQTLLISQIVEVTHNPQADYQQALLQIDDIIAKVSQPIVPTVFSTTDKRSTYGDDDILLDVDDATFMQLILRAQAYIKAGDAFQVVLSRCFKQRYSSAPLDIYRALRQVSPSPYMFYLPHHDRVILGASPEKLISINNREVAINPIAGTRQHVEKSADSEQKITAELLNDPKEQAEHMMLVDLARNDLGVVCKPGSIKIKELLNVRHYSHVSHITSVITGQLRDDRDAFDALAAAFPAGTLSGAPKIRAMQIIDELETSRRGMYGGVICRLDYLGNLDSCIAIRMAVLTEGMATVRTGAGVVYDSNPLSEANETRQKACAMLAAIKLAEERL